MTRTVEEASMMLVTETSPREWDERWNQQNICFDNPANVSLLHRKPHCGSNRPRTAHRVACYACLRREPIFNSTMCCFLCKEPVTGIVHHAPAARSPGAKHSR